MVFNFSTNSRNIQSSNAIEINIVHFKKGKHLKFKILISIWLSTLNALIIFYNRYLHKIKYNQNMYILICSVFYEIQYIIKKTCSQGVEYEVGIHPFFP